MLEINTIRSAGRVAARPTSSLCFILEKDFIIRRGLADGQICVIKFQVQFGHSAAAAGHAIKELKSESGFDDPGLTMVVEDDARPTVLSLPSLPAYT
jgi:hypothetical protein